ncbi:Aste57867_8563 [Aphanomyces stellatus]|uniref:Aste57867_8563 protein n=1 Tax=Aphanomyces stellatus TaxID=120398 RepID=A0A485KKQ6_9STRA|nr:hypothetical protein As57867_008531 [Aphanomyces stellatus]VFT85449.1 Aste57867_8563 [Aphanomyces stellatus]
MSAPAPIPEEVGILLNPQQRSAVQDRVNALLGWNSKELAPMAMGMPMLRTNRKQIVELGYLVGSLWSGIRYLALLVAGRCYLISHNYEIRETWLFTPLRQQDRPAAPPGTEADLGQHMWTILDGTLVMNQDKLCFVISDLLAMNGLSVMTNKLEDRLKTIQNSIISPLLKTPLPKGHPPSQFSLLFPPNRPLNKMASSIRHLTPTPTNTAVQHSGLVFIPLALPYAPGHSKGLYYWTYPTLTTAFFQLGVEWRGVPKKQVFKLNMYDKGMSVFYDWISFPPDVYEHFRSDKKASQRLIECVYDADCATFIPSDDKNDAGGNPNYQLPDVGVGWRKGGWKLIRVRKDIGRPLDRTHVLNLEKALVDNIRGEEIEHFFVDDPRKPGDEWKKGAAAAAVAGTTTGQGVCYDFQNKGVCQRGTKCHFSHCACHNVCTCTPQAHTYGQRPDFRRNDFDAPPDGDKPVVVVEGGIVVDGEETKDEASDAPRDKPADAVAVAAAAVKMMPVVAVAAPTTAAVNQHARLNPNPSSVYAPLTGFDKETLAAKRALLSATGNRRVWSSLGIDESKKGKKKPRVGWIVSQLGDVSYVRDK